MNKLEKQEVQKISRILRCARKHRGLTQIEVARILGVTQSQLSKMEHEVAMPTMYQWYTFCQKLNIDSNTYYYGYLDNLNQIKFKDISREGIFQIPKDFGMNSSTSVRAIMPFIDFFVKKLGQLSLESFLKSRKLDPDYFSKMDHQLSIGFTIDILCALIKKRKLKPSSMNELTSVAKESWIHGKMQNIYSTFASPIERIIQLFDNIDKYDDSFDYKIVDYKKNKLVYSFKPKKHLDLFSYDTIEDLGNFFSLYQKDYLLHFSQYHSTSKSKVTIHESSCYFKGNDQCLFTISTVH